MDKLTKVYVVCGKDGDYSDYSEWNVCACLTKARAVEITDKLNEALKIKRILESRLYSEFAEPYRKEHTAPKPPVKSKEYHALTQSVNTGKAPEEKKLAFRAARAAYEAENRTYMEAITAFYMAEDAARKEWLDGNISPEVEWAKTLGDEPRGDGYNWYELKIVE